MIVQVGDGPPWPWQFSLEAGTTGVVMVFTARVGLTATTPSLRVWYQRDGEPNTTVALVADATPLTWLSGGFGTVGSSDRVYGLGVPDAVLAAGAQAMTIRVGEIFPNTGKQVLWSVWSARLWPAGQSLRDRLRDAINKVDYDDVVADAFAGLGVT